MKANILLDVYNERKIYLEEQLQLCEDRIRGAKQKGDMAEYNQNYIQFMDLYTEYSALRRLEVMANNRISDADRIEAQVHKLLENDWLSHVVEERV